MQYRVVEIPKVTDFEIEAELNRLSEDGWAFLDIRFIMREGVRRPAMAFLFVVRDPSGLVTKAPTVANSD